jgi:hypothetical protein
MTRRMIYQNIAAATTAIVVVAALSWSRIPPVEVIDSHVSTPIVERGGFFDVDRTLVWLRRDCEKEYVTSMIVDSLGFNHMMEAKFLGAPSLSAKSRREWQVPYTMPQGAATYRSKISFYCQPFFSIWPIEVSMPDLRFMVR